MSERRKLLDYATAADRYEAGAFCPISYVSGNEPAGFRRIAFVDVPPEFHGPRLVAWCPVTEREEEDVSYAATYLEPAHRPQWPDGNEIAFPATVH